MKIIIQDSIYIYKLIRRRRLKLHKLAMLLTKFTFNVPSGNIGLISCIGVS